MASNGNRPSKPRLAQAAAFVLLATVSLGPGCASYDDSPMRVETEALGPAKPEHGFQVHVGPIAVPVGSEVQRCTYFKLASDEEVDITRIQFSFTGGSHHQMLFRTNKAFPDKQEDCWNALTRASAGDPDGFDLVANSQSGDMDWKLPEGVGLKLKPRQQLVLQSHYVNASTQKTDGASADVWINLHTESDRSKIKHRLGTFFGGNRDIRLPPRSKTSVSKTCTVPADINLITLWGHFHSRGRRFTVETSDSPAGPLQLSYESLDWTEPPFNVLAPPKALKAGSQIKFTCEYENETDVEIITGPKVESDEHCILFSYFYPSPGDTQLDCGLDE